MMGKRAKTFKYGLSTAADHFPNTLFKMYLFNTPFIFRTVWVSIFALTNALLGSRVAGCA